VTDGVHQPDLSSAFPRHPHYTFTVGSDAILPLCDAITERGSAHVVHFVSLSTSCFHAVT